MTMRKLLSVILLLLALGKAGYCQNINWRSLNDGQRNVMQLNFGYDFGVTTQLGYGRVVTLIRPTLLELDYSSPMGNTPTDDFKVRLGGQMELVEVGGFSATVKISSVFRRYQTELVSIASFGSDFAAVAGYYESSWFAAGEFGFDKAITSHLQHSDIMRAYYPALQDGWYIPTGGHYYYGVQGGKTLGETLDLSLRMGATSSQDHDENPVLPFYLQLGLGARF